MDAVSQFVDITEALFELSKQPFTEEGYEHLAVLLEKREALLGVLTAPINLASDQIETLNAMHAQTMHNIKVWQALCQDEINQVKQQREQAHQSKRAQRVYNRIEQQTDGYYIDSKK